MLTQEDSLGEKVEQIIDNETIDQKHSTMLLKNNGGTQNLKSENKSILIKKKQQKQIQATLWLSEEFPFSLD